MMSQTGKGKKKAWHLCETGPGLLWLSRNAGIINRQSEGSMSVHKSMATLRR